MSEPTYRIAQSLLARRAEVGLYSYGEHLKPFNKRCSLIDAIEESADMLCYLLNMAQESRHLLIDLMANSVRLREAGHTAAADGLDKIIVGMGGKETLAKYDEILGTVAENATVAALPKDADAEAALATVWRKEAEAEICRMHGVDKRKIVAEAIAELSAEQASTDPRDEALRVAIEALNEAACWVPDGTRRSPLERGAKVGTVHDLMQMIIAAIRAAGGGR